MKLAHFRHGADVTQTSGGHLEHGRGYDMFAAIFFGGRRRQVFTRLARLSGAHPGDRALDVGCGTGYFTRVMAEAVTPAGSALGIDPSPEIVGHARRRTQVANCTFSEGTAEALGAPESSLDVVVTSLMIHHLPEALRRPAIGEMFRVLRPGGRVLVADFRPPARGIGARLVGAIMGPAMEMNPVHLLEPMVRAAGFEQVCTGDVRPWIAYVQAVKPSP